MAVIGIVGSAAVCIGGAVPVELLLRAAGYEKPAEFPPHPVYPHQLNRLKVSAPNSLRRADNPFVPLLGGYLYLVVIMANTADICPLRRGAGGGLSAGDAGPFQCRPGLPVHFGGLERTRGRRRRSYRNGRLRPLPRHPRNHTARFRNRVHNSKCARGRYLIFHLTPSSLICYPFTRNCLSMSGKLRRAPTAKLLIIIRGDCF